MSLISAQVAIASDSLLARDAIVNTLHFNGVGTFLGLTETPATDLANDLADIYANLPGMATRPRQIDVKLYDLDDDMPRPLKAHVQRNVGLAPSALQAREVALCFSYYAGRNLPRNRGRIYLFPDVIATNPATGTRPSQNMMNAAIALHQQFADLGGTDVEWSVFSRADNQHKKVTDSYVDDEWDTVRSRGLRPTTRVTAHAEG